MSTTTRTDSIAHGGYTERGYIVKMTELARILETELAAMTARAEKAEAEVERLFARLYKACDDERDMAISEGLGHGVCGLASELTTRAEKAEAESNKLLKHGIQVLMIARSWVMVWGDKLSPDSVALFTKHEREFLSAKEASK